jgi:hypothetical protein
LRLGQLLMWDSAAVGALQAKLDRGRVGRGAYGATCRERAARSGAMSGASSGRRNVHIRL